MSVRARCLQPLPTVLGLALLSFTASSQAVTGIAGSLALRIQILDDNGAISAARVELASLTPPMVFVQYTDASGEANFTGLVPGRFMLTAGTSGRALYRNELVLAADDRSSTKVIHVRRPAVNAKAETVSLNELSVPAKAKSLFDAGLAAVHLNRWPRAIEAFNQAITVAPTYARAYNALGVAFAITKKEKESEQAFRKAIESDKTFAEPHYNLGKLLLETDRTLEGRHELERTLQLSPRDRPAIELLVESMILTHDEDAAVALMSSVDKNKIQHPVQLHLEIGFTLENHDKLELAYGQYFQVLKENASGSESRLARAGLVRLGRLRPPVAPR